MIQRDSLQILAPQSLASTKSSLETLQVPRCSRSRGRGLGVPHRQRTPALGLSNREVKSLDIIALHDVILVEST